MSQLSEHDSFSVLESWGQCVKAKDRKAVLAHYAHNTGATLWPTLSNKLRKDEDHVEDYFVSFLAKIDGVGPVEWNEKVAQPMSDDCVMWSGVYTFHLNQGKVPARFSYLVKKIDEEWKIMHHHSSQMPE